LTTMNEVLRILMLEDTQPDAELILRELDRQGICCTTTQVETEAEFLEQLRTFQPDLVLADYSLPCYNGLAALASVRKTHPEMPFIFVSGSLGEEKAVEALHCGATDYVLKQRMSRLGPAVQRALRELKLINERKRSEERLYKVHSFLLNLGYDYDQNVQALTALCGELLEADCVLYGRLEGPRLCIKGQWKAPPGMPMEDIAQGHICFEVIQGQSDGALVIRHLQGTFYAKTDPNVVPYGLQTYWGHPVRFGGITHGSLCAVFTRDCEPTSDDLRILGILAAAIGQDEERNRAEENLRRSEQRYRLLAGHVADVLWTFDLETRRLTYVSPSVHRLRGYTAEEAIAQSLEQMLTAESLAMVNRMIEERVRAFQAGDPTAVTQVHEVQVTRKNDSPVWSEMVTTFLRNERGGISVMGVSRDITERKRAQDAHRLLVTAVEQSAEAILITDSDGKILFTNPAFTLVTGYTAEEAIGQNPRILKSGRHDVGFYQQMWAVLSKGEVWSGRLINRRKDGTLFEEHATISPIRDSTGRVINYVAVKRDVTREVLLEAQFRQAQKMEAIGQLAGGVAHDFNNILAAMLMQAELAELVESLPGAARDCLREIRAYTERAAALTRQLLLFSRRQVIQPRELDLNEVVSSLAKMLQRIIGEDVRLQLHLHAAPLMTRADEGMLGQVLLNLAVNARDAMPKGGQMLIETAEKIVDESLARLNPDAAPGRYVCLIVSDTGCGIPPEVMPRIFEPFFTTKEPGKGTGLGLATVFGIVKQHHGLLKVESKPGQGVKFQIILPASTASAADPSAAVARPEPREGTETILLVEDEWVVRTLTRAILTRYGYKVLEAPNGVEALKLWHEHRGAVALLVTDLVMPEGLSGQELARRLQADQPQLKVIYISGYSAEIAGQELQLRSGENFIQKPFAPDQLLGTIRHYLDE